MLTVILLFSCIFAAVPSYAAVTDLPELTGQSAILINADLWVKFCMTNTRIFRLIQPVRRR